MQGLTEIRWHARTGQGAVTAAKLVAETALESGRYMQAMPEYGPERTGAPLKAYTRVSDQPIELHNNIVNPDIVIVLDDTLLDVIDVLEGMHEGGQLIVNTRECVADIRKKIDAPEHIDIAVVPATDISLEHIGRDLPNTPIAGALAKVTGVIDVEALKSHLKSSFSEKFSEKVVDANLASVQEAYEEVLTR